MKFYSKLHWVGLILLSCGLLAKYLASRPNVISPTSEAIATVSSRFELKNTVPVATIASEKTSTPIFVSPFEIQRFMKSHRNEEYFSLKEIWQKLGVDVGLWEGCSHCTMKLFPLHLNQKTGEKRMLWFQPMTGGIPRLLFFSRDNIQKAKWKFIGKLDLQDYNWKPFPHRIVSMGKYRWIVFKLLVGKGSGYRRTDEDWYEIHSDKIIPVLSYPIEAGTYYYPNRESSARIINIQSTANQPIITIRFSVAYSWYNEPNKSYLLWQKTQKASFIRQANSGVFVLQPYHSEATTYEIDMVYGGEGVVPEEVVKYNYAELLTIARGKEGKPKAWLRSYLENSKLIPTPNITKLTELLRH